MCINSYPYTVWNVGVRILLNLPKLYIYDLKYIYCMKNIDNDLVSSCLNMCPIMQILFFGGGGGE